MDDTGKKRVSVSKEGHEKYEPPNLEQHKEYYEKNSSEQFFQKLVDFGEKQFLTSELKNDSYNPNIKK